MAENSPPKMSDNLVESIDERIETVAIDDLIPYQNNPKEHPEEQVKKIADSIHEYGYTVPIIIDGDNRIIAGHGRYQAITKHTDFERVACIRRDDLNEAQAKAFRLADNRIAESEWDVEQLSVELEELEFEEYDLDLTGFDDGELTDFLENDDGENGGDKYTDKIEGPTYEPNGPKPPVSDLYSNDRSQELVEAVENVDVEDDELQEFLRLAAHRHVVFDYENIAEFYAHAEPEVQELMEELTLVIIDFDQAMEQGFINFAEDALGGVQKNDG